jgi:hypothetical protein
MLTLASADLARASLIEVQATGANFRAGQVGWHRRCLARWWSRSGSG